MDNSVPSDQTVNTNHVSSATSTVSSSGLTQEMYNQLVSLLKNAQSTESATSSSSNFAGYSIDLSSVACLFAYKNNIRIIDSGTRSRNGLGGVCFPAGTILSYCPPSQPLQLLTSHPHLVGRSQNITPLATPIHQDPTHQIWTCLIYGIFNDPNRLQIQLCLPHTHLNQTRCFQTYLNFSLIPQMIYTPFGFINCLH